MTSATTAPQPQPQPVGPASPADGELRLPRPPGVFRRWLAAHPRLVDGAIVGCYLFGCALMVTIDATSTFAADVLTDIDATAAEAARLRAAYLAWPWVLVAVLVTAIVAVALAYRRRFPLAGLIVVSALMLFEQGLLALPNSVAVVFLLYAVPVYRSVRAGWLGFGVALVLSAAMMQFTGGTSTGLIGPAGIVVAEDPASVGDRIGMNTLNAVWLLAVLMVGINMGNRRRYVDALIDRARQLARDQEQRAQLAAAAERARIAREMHDIVAHSLSVMVTLSEAAAVSIDAQPEAAKQAARRAGETGRTALVEMRRLLGVLGEQHAGAAGGAGTDGAERLAPQPGIGELAALVAGFEDAGLRVALLEHGAPAGDPTQQLAVYRIVQEALTNALRHAGPGAAVELRLDHAAESTRIEVVDAGPAATGRRPAPAIPGSGRGLAGAEQRARMFGGSLESGPHGTGWRVTAVVPVGAEPEAETGSGTEEDA